MSPRTKSKASQSGSFEELSGQIAERYPELKGQLKRIAEFAVENPNEIALKTVAQVAEDIGVQPSSMVRFAKALGYDGFSDVQQVFRTRLIDASSSYAERIRSARRESPATDGAIGPNPVLADFVDQGISALENLRLSTPPEKIAQAIEILAGAKDIYLLAQRRAFPVAIYLRYALPRLEQRCVLLDGIGGLLNYQASLATREDAIIAVSFRPYSPSVVEIVTERSETGVPIIAITDSTLSPLALESRVSFETHEHKEHGFSMLVAPMCLAQALVVNLGHHLAAEANGKDQA